MSEQMTMFEVKEIEKPKTKYKYFFRFYKISGCFDCYVSQTFDGYKSLSGEVFGTFDDIVVAYEHAIAYCEKITKHYPTTWLKKAIKNIKESRSKKWE